jgi:NitT/TauT family transport system ATP-binding protein
LRLRRPNLEHVVDIAVRELYKVWGEVGNPRSVLALDGVTHAFGSGRITTIVGPSGCGKSTMLEIIGGIESQTAGEITITDPDDGQRQVKPGEKSVMVWQSFNLLPWRNVIDNVALGLEAMGMPRPQRLERSRELLANVGLSAFAERMPAQLSGGMRQRVALARALAVEPSVLLMDEPFGALDAQTRLLMQEELLRLVEGTGRTVLFVTHSIEEAILLGDEVVVMSARPGKIVDVFDVDLPRPRKIDMLHTQDYANLFDRTYGQLRDQVSKANESEAQAS